MPLPGNWTIEEILELSYLKGLHSDLLRMIIENYSSSNHLNNSKPPPKLSAIFNKNEMFANKEINSNDEAKKQIDICEKNNFMIVTYWDENYPVLLKEIDHPPIILFVKGELQENDSASISIVGTRKCTNYGKLTAERFSEYFARNGIIVCSGMAYGIDTKSHLAAIKAKGITYAVIASGLDEINPSTAEQLSEKIVESGGAIITEYKCGTKALPAYFPQRNRIISGISKATLIVESETKGGSLITAQFALNQSREVFAVPGNINSLKSGGTNRLIKKSSATPALNPKEMLEELGFSRDQLDFEKEKSVTFDSETEKKIYDILSHEPMQIDEISGNSGVDITEIMVKLLKMEFDGYVRQLPGKLYIKSN